MSSESSLSGKCPECGKGDLACQCSGLMTTPSQWAFLQDKRRFLYFNGGRGSGKSTAAVLKIAGMIEDGTILPGARIGVFGPTYPQLKKGTLLTFDKWMGPYDPVTKIGFNLIEKPIEGSEPERRLVNDIVAYFRNASNPDQTRSHENQIIWLDEVAQMDEQVIPLTNATLRQFGNDAHYQTLMTSTPRGQNWLYRMFVDPATRIYKEEQIGYYQSSTVEAWEYGVVRDDYIQEMGYVPGTEMWKQEVLAEYVTWSGLVFPYKPSIHTPDPFILPKFVKVVGGVDIGQVQPTALILLGMDEQGAIWVFKEYYQRRANMHDWMRVAAEWTQEYNVRCWYVDSAADLELRAMKTTLPAKPSVKQQDAAGAAVNFIVSKMEREEFFISPECPNLRGELLTYQFKEIATGLEKTFLDKVKENQPDHAIDAMRYGALPLSQFKNETLQKVEIVFG